MNTRKARSTIADFLSNTEKQGNCLVWKGTLDKEGYPRQHYSKSKPFGKSVIGVHRKVLELSLNRPIKEGHVACHKCDNPSCINPDHLWEGTQKDNITDCHSKGRSGKHQRPKGEENKQSKLTNTDVVEIFRLRAEEKLSMTELAIKFNTNSGSISRILNRKHWSHIDIPREYLENLDLGVKSRPCKKLRKLSEEDVERIKELSKSLTSKEIAEMFQTTPKYVNGINRGDKRKHG